MKRVCFFLLILSTIFLFSSCQKKEYDLPLHQPIENIVQIELSEHTFGERNILLTLNGNKIAPFLKELLTIKCYKHFNDPPTEYGYLSVFVYYQNNDIDILGTDICSYVSTTDYQDSWYYVSLEVMLELFSHYLSNDVLPDFN